ncbi:hypothetical protein STEG23_015322 [Scotinomys teguina]
MKAAASRCQLLLILLMSAVMLLPGTNSSLLLVQRTVTRTIVLQETIGKVEPDDWLDSHPCHYPTESPVDNSVHMQMKQFTLQDEICL